MIYSVIFLYYSVIFLYYSAVRVGVFMKKCFFESNEHRTTEQLPFLFYHFYMNPDEEIYVHRHKDTEIIYCVEGTGDCIVNETNYKLTPGKILSINPYDVHTMTTPSYIDYYALIILDSFCIQNGINVYNNILPVITENEAILPLIEQACAEFYSSKPDVLKLRIMVMNIIHEMYSKFSYISNTNNLANYKDIFNAIAYVNEHYSEDISVEQVANIAGLSKFYFMKKFKEFTGFSFITFLNLIRCRSANALIARGASVSSAAFECGFHDVAFFSRTYKKLMGATPSLQKKALKKRR